MTTLHDNRPSSSRQALLFACMFNKHFLLFCISGGIAFLIDSAVLTALAHSGLENLYIARLLSFWCAVTFTWLFNRSITFRERQSPHPLHREYLLYVSANSIGGIVNYGVFALAVTLSNYAHTWPIIGIAAGSIAGLAFNFIASRFLIFRHERPTK